MSPVNTPPLPSVHPGMRIIVFLPFLIAAVRAETLAGGWEAFPVEANADTWALYSYDDQLVAPPLWAGPDIDENPYAYSYFLGGDAVWFFADEFTVGGVLVGDYAAEKISGVDVSVSIDPAEIDFIDLAIYADGPAGPGYYYSRIYEPADLGTDPTWYDLHFRFDENWFYVQGGGFVAFKPGAGLLSSVEEVGLRVFPSTGVTSESFVGIDDFILVPTIAAPPLSTSVAGGDFKMAFTPNPGVSATIERLSDDHWLELPGETGLEGPQVFSTSTAPGTGLFRVVTSEKLTPVAVP